ncbi:Uncharacterised protein [Bifidobacterium bifidum]|nr:Uncharacterised protein [Bifidobacterium bifidum]
MGFMSPDSAFMRGLSNTVDAIWINLLIGISCIVYRFGAQKSPSNVQFLRSLDVNFTVRPVCCVFGRSYGLQGLADTGHVRRRE